jgi:hypothetical protein
LNFFFDKKMHLLFICLVVTFAQKYRIVWPPAAVIQKFPVDGPMYDYFVDFNKTIMQANFVYHFPILTDASCVPEPDVKYDPYNVDKVLPADYQNSTYEQGLLVANSDYGCGTFFMPNIVPMMATFKGGIWDTVTQKIKEAYHDKLTLKGCEYQMNKFVTTNNTIFNKLYLPIGCYFIVFDEVVMPAQIIFSGFVCQECVAPINALPWWIARV